MIAAIVLAKGDSNRIPKKNMKKFCGRPLVGWTIEQCLCSKLIDITAVSTDCPDVKEYALSMGAIVIDRPYELTLTPANQAAAHALGELKKAGHTIDTVVGPLPTSPVRLPHDIDGLVSLHLTVGWDLAASCCEQLETIAYKKTNGVWAKTVIFDKHHGHYVDGGGMQCANVTWYLEYLKKVPMTDEEYDTKVQEQIAGKADHGFVLEQPWYVMKEWQTPELDLPEHWGVAEAVMNEYILKPYGVHCYKEYKHGKKN